MILNEIWYMIIEYLNVKEWMPYVWVIAPIRRAIQEQARYNPKFLEICNWYHRSNNSDTLTYYAKTPYHPNRETKWIDVIEYMCMEKYMISTAGFYSPKWLIFLVQHQKSVGKPQMMFSIENRPPCVIDFCESITRQGSFLRNVHEKYIEVLE